MSDLLLLALAFVLPILGYAAGVAFYDMRQQS